MLTTKHAGQTLWRNKNDTEDLWMPMVKHTAADHYHSKLLTGKSFFLFQPTNVPIPLVEKLTKINVCQRTVSEMITYRQLNKKAKTSSPILIILGLISHKKLYPQIHTLHTPSITPCCSSVFLFCSVSNVYFKNKNSSSS